MRKRIIGMALALAGILPVLGHAVPVDVPFVVLVSTNNTGQVVLSTANFPSANTTVNSTIATGGFQWCVTHVALSGPLNANQANFTLAYSSAPLLQALPVATTDYKVIVTTTPYEVTWAYRQPYCSPVNQAVLTITSSIATAVIEVEGYLWKGWSGLP